jgi:hypothetical protein
VSKWKFTTSSHILKPSWQYLTTLVVWAWYRQSARSGTRRADNYVRECVLRLQQQHVRSAALLCMCALLSAAVAAADERRVRHHIADPPLYCSEPFAVVTKRMFEHSRSLACIIKFHLTAECWMRLKRCRYLRARDAIFQPSYLRIAYIQQPDLLVRRREFRAARVVALSAGLVLSETTAVWATMLQRYMRLKFSLNSSKLLLEAHTQELKFSKSNTWHLLGN